MPKSPERCAELRGEMRARILRESLRYFARNGFAGTRIADLARGIGIAQGNQRILHPIHSCAAACTFIQRQNPTVSEKAQIKQTQIAFSPYLLHEARTFHRNFRQLLGHIHSSFNGLIYSIYPKEAVQVLVKWILLIVNHFIFYH